MNNKTRKRPLQIVATRGARECRCNVQAARDGAILRASDERRRVAAGRIHLLANMAHLTTQAHRLALGRRVARKMDTQATSNPGASESERQFGAAHGYPSLRSESGDVPTGVEREGSGRRFVKRKSGSCRFSAYYKLEWRDEKIGSGLF